MEDNKLDRFTRIYNKNKSLLNVLNAPENKEIYKAFWDAREDEINDLKGEIEQLLSIINEQTEVIDNKDKFIQSFEKTENILKKEITNTGHYIHSLNENINLQAQEIEKLKKALNSKDEVAQDLRFVISEQKSEKTLLSQNIVDSQSHIKDLQEQISKFEARERIIKQELVEISSKTKTIEESSREQVEYLIEQNEKLQQALNQRDDIIEQSKRYAKEYRTINSRLSEELLRMKHKVKQVQLEGPAALIDCH